MFYNENIFYNSINITYNGSVNISVPGIPVPINVEDLTVVIGSSIDYANATYSGEISFDYFPTGVITIQATQQQASAIAESNIIFIEVDAQTMMEINKEKTAIILNSSKQNDDNVAEIQAINISQMGSLFTA